MSFSRSAAFDGDFSRFDFAGEAGPGDAASRRASSCYLLYEAHRIGVPRLLLARMAGNIVIEAIFGAVPIAGDAFDVFFRANRRNVALLREHFARKGYR